MKNSAITRFIALIAVSAIWTFVGLPTQASALDDAGNHQAADNAEKNKSEKAHGCHVKCTSPHAACEESQKVIDTLNHLVKALNDGDFATVGDYMDESISTFDEGSKKLIVGREAVLAEMKRRYEKSKQDSEGGTVSYHIEHPYAQVSGDRATVTFVIRKTVSGKTPIAMESHSTDVFVKHEGKWKKLHYRSNWKKVSVKANS
ncbi:MAG: nuclear transport factor 2 family protein [Candidatus Obscuribacterales bacterium]|nr:nuclear transport factor 2 family protein [Candidatus Obscuribacterales bacterium]